MTNREVKKWYTEDEVIRILQNVSDDGKAITVEEYKKQRLQYRSRLLFPFLAHGMKQ